MAIPTVVRESHVKNEVKKAFAAVDNPDMLYSFMSVPNRYGTSTLDFICVYKGVPFAIETKAPGKRPTGRQQKIAQDLLTAGCTVFVIDNITKSALSLLKVFLESIDKQRPSNVADPA